MAGKSPYPYINAFNAALFLSATEPDVKAAVLQGLPAGLVLPTKAKDQEDDGELRIAFDFDGVVADDEAEAVYRKTKDIGAFYRTELQKAAQPHNAGPLKDLITKIAFIQKLEAKKAKETPGYRPALRIAIVTARDAPANERMVTTLNAWGLTAIEAFFLGGIEKKRILDVFAPHIFFDDQLENLRIAAASVPSVHVPFGVVNKLQSPKE